MSGGETNQDSEVLEEAMQRAGAIIVGKRMFNNAEEWGDDPPFKKPVFVLTHETRDPLEKGETTFTFVEGVESALEKARAAAGDKDVSVAGGASTIQQFLSSGLLDEIQVHVVPLLLGGGVRLFDELEDPPGLEQTRLIESPAVTHLRYRVVK